MRPCAFFTCYCVSCQKKKKRGSTMNFVFVRFLVPISQMKCRKKVFSKPLFFFFWEGRCNGEWCPQYWICGKEQQYYSSLLKRTKTLPRFKEVDFNIKMMIWFMPHFFWLKSHLVWQRLTEDRITSRPQNNILKLVYSFSYERPWTAHNTLHKKKKKCLAPRYRCHGINGLPIRGLLSLQRNDEEY